MNTTDNLTPLLKHFFTDRLMQQHQTSPHTINSYQNTFRQLLKFAQQRLRKAPSNLMFKQIDTPLIMTFLDHLKQNQKLSIRNRNLRLTTIHSFFRYTTLEAPVHSTQI